METIASGTAVMPSRPSRTVPSAAGASPRTSTDAHREPRGGVQRQQRRRPSGAPWTCSRPGP